MIRYSVFTCRWMEDGSFGIDPTKVTILAMSTRNYGLRPAWTHSYISDYLPRRIGRQSILGHACFCCQEARPWARCSFGRARGTLGLYRGWAYPATSRNVSSRAGCGFAFRETVANSLPHGRAILYLEKGKVPATRDQLSKETY